jgi:hypothetical protein
MKEMAQIKNTLIALITATSLTACSNIPQPVVVDAKPIDRPVLIIPSVDEFNSRDVEWIVITPENINVVFADLQDANEEIVLIAATPAGMRNLTLNMADLLKLVQQQKTIIATYQQYYETQKP